MAGDDYEIVSHKEIIDLKKQIDSLKNTKKGDVSNKSLKESIDTLNKNLELMIELFKEANKMMRTDEKEAMLVTDKMGPLISKIDTLLEQNQTVAKGILSVADLVKGETRDDKPKEMPRPARMEIRPPEIRPQPRAQLPPMQQYPETNMQPQLPPLQQHPDMTPQRPPIQSPPSFPDPNLTTNIPPLPKGQPESLGPSIQPPPGKKPLFRK